MPNLPLTDKTFYQGSGNPYKDIIKSTDILIKELQKVSTEATKTAQSLSIQAKTNPKQTAQDYKELSNTITELGRNVQAATKANQEAEKLDITRRKLLTEQAKLNAQNTVAIQQQRKALKDQAKESLGLVGAYEKLTKQTNEAQKRFKNLATEFGANSKQAKAAKKEFETLDDKLRKVNKAAKDGRRDVGRYTLGWQGLKKALIGGLGFLGITKGISALRSKLTQTITDFDKQAKAEKALEIALGKTSKELLKQASALQKVTKFGDEQIIQGQAYLAQLNVQEDQIKSITPLVLDFAEAQGIKLDDAFKLVGKSLGSSTNALSRYGIQIEGEVGSQQRLESAVNSLSNAFAGQATAAANVGTGGLTQLKNLVGDLRESFGALILKGLNPMLPALSSIVTSIDDWVKINASEEIENERTQVIKLTSKLQDANTSYEDRKIILNELNKIAPDVVDGISAEEIAYEDLNKQLDKYLENSIQRIAIAELEEERTKELTKIANLRIKQSESLIQSQEILTKVSDEFRQTEGSLQEQIKGTIGLLAKEVDRQKEVGEAGEKTVTSRGTIIDTRTEEQKQLQDLINTFSFYSKKEEEIQDKSNDTISVINEKIKVLKEQLGITEEINDAEDPNKKPKKEILENQDNELTAYEKLTKKLQDLEKEKKAINLNDFVSLKLKQDDIDLVKLQIETYEKFFSTFEDAPDDIDLNLDLGLDLDNNSDKILEQLENIRKEEIDAEVEKFNTLKSIEEEGYNSIIGIFFNYKRRKIAADEELTKKERDEQLKRAEQQEEATQQLAETLIGIYNSILESRLNQINTEIEEQNQKINEQEQQLNRELDLLKAGAANEYATEKAKLEKLQAERDKDLAERRKIQKQQQNVDTLTQISALTTAIANIIEGFSTIPIVGVVLGLAAAASAIIGFTTYKSDAESSVRAEEGGTFKRKGSFIEKGNRHSEGGNKYNALETEKGELHAILSRKATNKYGDFFEQITDLANEDKLSPDELEMYRYSINKLEPNTIVMQNNYSDLLKEIKGVRQLINDKKTPVYDNKGNLIFFDNYGLPKRKILNR